MRQSPMSLFLFLKVQHYRGLKHVLSNWLSSIKSSLSPKAWLAKRLSQMLHDFFVLEKEHKIESSLLTDTKIVLRNAPIRSREIGTGRWLSGTVEEIEFSWTWGGPKKGGFVKDTKLSIRGAQLRITVGVDEDLDEDYYDCNSNDGSRSVSNSESYTNSAYSEKPDMHTCENPDSLRSTSSSTSSDKPKQKGYVQTEIDQIMDHLTLCVSDVKIIVETSESRNDVYAGICLEASSLHLMSPGRQASVSFDELPPPDSETTTPDIPLSQRISLESFSARVLKSANAGGSQVSLPLIDPIGYAASVTRVAGRRFLDGLTTGLEIVGDILLVPQECYRSELAIHAGTDQIESICRLMNLFNTTTPDPSSHHLAAVGVPTYDNSLELHDPLVTAGPPTNITLPLPSVCFALPGGTTIRMPGCSFCYEVDGSVSYLNGTQGIWVNDTEVLRIGDSHTNTVESNTEWRIDFAQQKITLQQKQLHTNSTTGNIDLSDAFLKELLKEFSLMLSCIPDPLIEQAKSVLEDTEETLRRQSTKWAFETSGLIGIHVSCGSDWVHASLRSLCVGISTHGDTGTIQLERLETGGMEIGPVSFGEKGSTHLRIPGIHSHQPTGKGETPCIEVQGYIEGCLESETVAYSIHHFLTSLASMGIETVPIKLPNISEGNILLRETSKATSTPSMWRAWSLLIPRFDFAIKAPNNLVVSAENIEVQCDTVEAAVVSVSADHPSPFACKLVHARAQMADFEHVTISISEATIQRESSFDVHFTGLMATGSRSNAKATIENVSWCRIPNMFELLDPVENLSMTFGDGVLDLGNIAVRGVCPMMILSDSSRRQDRENSSKLPDLPFSIRSKISYLQLFSTRESLSSLHAASVDLYMSQDGEDFTLKSNGTMKARIVDTSKQQMIQASIGPTSLSVNLSSTGLISKASCDQVLIGPCSMGKVNVIIPSIEVKESLAITCGDVSGDVESSDLVQSIQQLWKDCFPSESNQPTSISISVPKAIFNITSLNAVMVAETITSSSPFREIACHRFGAQDREGKSFALAGISAKLEPSMYLEASRIDAFYLPGACSIEKPVVVTSKAFLQDNTIFVEIPPIQILIFEGGKQQCKGGGSLRTGGNTAALPSLPFPIRFSFREVLLKQASSQEFTTRISYLGCQMEQRVAPASTSTTAKAISYWIGFDSVENELLRIGKTGCSGIVCDASLSTIRELRVATESAEVTTGFSSLDWSAMLGRSNKKKPSNPILLPFAMVKNLIVRIRCRGAIGVNQTPVSVPAFRGNANTNLDHIMDHFKTAVVGRVPAMITNAEVMGTSVSSLAAYTAGVALTGGMIGGSLVGLVAEDGIRGAIDKGKQSRNAGTGERYRFGDITRGAIRAIKDTAKSGAEIRRGNQDGYRFGDITAGLTKGGAEYTSSNASRLGTAGLSGVGMVLGCAVAGPVGLVAGSLIGSKVGQEAFGKGTSQPKPPSTPQNPQQPVQQAQQTRQQPNQRPQQPNRQQRR